MVAETWEQWLMWGSTAMSLHERYFSEINELYSAWVSIAYQNKPHVCYVAKQVLPLMIFQDFSSGYLPLPYSPFTVIVKDLSI